MYILISAHLLAVAVAEHRLFAHIAEDAGNRERVYGCANKSMRLEQSNAGCINRVSASVEDAPSVRSGQPVHLVLDTQHKPGYPSRDALDRYAQTMAPRRSLV